MIKKLMQLEQQEAGNWPHLSDVGHVYIDTGKIKHFRPLVVSDSQTVSTITLTDGEVIIADVDPSELAYQINAGLS
jgi:hypothetical protein